MGMRNRIAVFVAVFQVVMLAGHAFLYDTWRFFRPVAPLPGISPLAWVTAILSVSFVVASLLAFRYHNRVVRWFYKIAAVLLGGSSLFPFSCRGLLGDY